MTVPIQIPTYITLAELTGPETWTRGQPRIDGDAIDLATLEPYDPRGLGTGDEILFELASIRSKNHIPRFARRFGLLRSAEPHQEQMSDWLAIARHLRAALTMHALLQEITAAAAEDVAQLARLEATIAPYRKQLGPEWCAFLDEYSLAEQATILIGEIVNPHLPTARLIATAQLQQTDEIGTWRIATGGNTDFFWGHRFDDLIQYAHHMLALTVAQGTPVRLCQGCSRVFVPDPPNKLYHDERCSNNARQRARRERLQPVPPGSPSSAASTLGSHDNATLGK